MKKLLLFAVIVLLSSFATRLYYDVQQSTAEVNQEQGVYIFTDSKPIKKYQYLGSVKITIGWNTGQYNDVKSALLKKLKKEYPTANGVIFKFNTNSTDFADAILLEE